MTINKSVLNSHERFTEVSILESDLKSIRQDLAVIQEHVSSLNEKGQILSPALFAGLIQIRLDSLSNRLDEYSKRSMKMALSVNKQ